LQFEALLTIHDLGIIVQPKGIGPFLGNPLIVSHGDRNRVETLYSLYSLCSDSVKRNLPIGYAVDLTPVATAKEAGASWNARRMTEIAGKLERAVDFASRKEYGSMASGRAPGKLPDTSKARRGGD